MKRLISQIGCNIYTYRLVFTKKNKETLKNIMIEEHSEILKSGDSSLAIPVELPK